MVHYFFGRMVVDGWVAWWVGSWVGVESENKAISAFNYDVVEVELGLR